MMAGSRPARRVRSSDIRPIDRMRGAGIKEGGCLRHYGQRQIGFR